MARARKRIEEPKPDGAPDWMVTFSDCMTLLLTFFVLLLSFSSFDERQIKELMKILSQEFSVSKVTDKELNAFTQTSIIQKEKDYKSGSEKPTLIKGEESSNLAESLPDNFQDNKVFLIPSENVFWGKGTVISGEGRKILSEMSSFLKDRQERIVISENEIGASLEGSNDLGLGRSWAVTEYLVSKGGLDEKMFSISVSNTASGGSDFNRIIKDQDNNINTVRSRNIEIVFLERSIYN